MTNKTKKISLADIKSKKLVDQIVTKNIVFWHGGEEYEVTVLLKQLPFAATNELFRRLNDDKQNEEDVIADWLALSVVDENGHSEFTAQQVKDSMVQPLVNELFSVVQGLDTLKKQVAAMNQDTSPAN